MEIVNSKIARSFTSIKIVHINKEFYFFLLDKKVVINDCHLGRFGTLLSVQHTSETEPDESIEKVTKGLCQHIIASSPLSIGNPADKPSTNTQDETRLLLQEYALDEDVTVKEILDENDLTVTDFVRFECGELLPEEKD